MTSVASPAGSQAPTGRERSVPSLVNTLARILGEERSRGDVAALRRLQPEDPSSPAFWRIAAGQLEPAGVFPAGEDARAEAERKWACILSALAILGRLHTPRIRLGMALAEAGFSELRFVRLLRARRPALFNEIRTAARYLASKGTPADTAELAQLVLTEGRRGGEAVRRRLARDYYA